MSVAFTNSEFGKPPATQEKPALKVWSYEIPKARNAEFVVKMPKDARILKAERVGNVAKMWALVNPWMAEEERYFWIGQDNFPLPSPGGIENYEITGLRHVGSYFGFGQMLHVFELEGCRPVAGMREPGEEG